MTKDKTILIRKTMVSSLNYSLYAVLALVCIVSAFVSPHFLTTRNIFSMLINNGQSLIVACGMGIVLITGLTDLSVGSIAYLSMVFAGIAINNFGFNIFEGILVCVLTGAVVGIINGIFMVRMKLSPLLVTLGMQLVLRGIAMVITQSMYIYMPKEVTGFMTNTFYGFPVVVLLIILLALLLHLVMMHTGFGKNVYAVGCNERAAKELGIKTESVKFACVIICDIFAALSGLYCACNLGTIQQTIGQSWEFNAIAIAVLGGVSLFGGYGKIFPGVVIGFLIITVIGNILGLIGVSTYMIPIMVGIVIFFAMFMNSLKYRYVGLSKLKL